MRHLLAALTFALLTAACGREQEPPAADETAPAAAEGAAPEAAGMPYPEARRGDVVDDYFGTEVADPYRWMEDPDSAELKTWIDAQNALANPWLEGLPEREAIKDRLTALWNYDRRSPQFKVAGRQFFERNDGIQNQSVLYMIPAPGAEPVVAIDPNGFSDDGTIALVRYNVSPDGRLIAYGLSDGGSDWTTMRIRDLATGEDLPDELADIKFTQAAWAADSQGFYYGRYPHNAAGEADDTQQTRIYFHRLGEAQADDVLFYEVTDHERRNPGVEVSEDGRFVIITEAYGYFENGLYYIDLKDPERQVVRLFNDWDARYEFLGNDGSIFYVSTNSEAPNRRVIAVDLDRPGREHWRDVVPESDTPIVGASLGGRHVVVNYLRDARSEVALYRLSGGRDGEIPLPGIGTVYGPDTDKPSSGDEDRLASRLDDSEVFFGFSSFTSPPSTYRFDIDTREVNLIERSSTDFDAEAFEAQQVFFESRDGTRVPMFVIHRKGLEADGDQPTLLYGYGGFNQSLTPGYSTTWAIWLEQGGIVAIPNLRGGGEYGKTWHEAGTKLDKQNTFDDFIAAAEWLIANGYTNPDKLAIYGGSNGGLLVGAVMLQRPELFGATMPFVGVLDMLRYHTASANARQWSSDFGLSENEDEFRAQYAYSPVHNVTPGTCYPPTLIQTGDHDDRVVPWHSFKFAAELQQAQGCAQPVLLSVETRGGHGAGKPTWMRIEEIANRVAFLRETLGMNAD
jgi:prolyl oligopeptidase